MDFFDVELDFCNDTYAPFRKSTFQARYVNTQSNYRRYVVRQIPKSINKRLSIISKNENSFDRAKEHYQEALTKGGHKHKLKYSSGNGRTREGKEKTYYISRNHFVCRYLYFL